MNTDNAVHQANNGCVFSKRKYAFTNETIGKVTCKKCLNITGKRG